ncbi:hypothetical protein IC232_31855 [Microvirga sp. BT688]|nr:hypothetical protein [Microvirga sp.]MBD2751228.1 hypothetical protein [Microvirga sp.]
MALSNKHTLEQLEHPRRHGLPYLIVATVGLLNIVATVTTLLAANPLF